MARCQAAPATLPVHEAARSNTSCARQGCFCRYSPVARRRKVSQCFAYFYAGCCIVVLPRGGARPIQDALYVGGSCIWEIQRTVKMQAGGPSQAASR